MEETCDNEGRKIKKIDKWTNGNRKWELLREK